MVISRCKILDQIQNINSTEWDYQSRVENQFQPLFVLKLHLLRLLKLFNYDQFI